MKSILALFLFGLSLFTNSLAQSILVEYDVKLGGDGGQSVNYAIDVWITDSLTTNLSQLANTKEASFVKKKREGFVYCSIGFESKRFDVKDSLPQFDWQLLPDTATILGRKCLAAQTSFRGRDYKVFYSPEIPVADGPWKFGGLPGLILEAESKDRFIRWRATALDLAYKGSMRYVDVRQRKYLTWREMTKQYIETADKFTHALRLKMAEQNLPLGAGTQSKYQTTDTEIIYPKINVEGVSLGY